MGALTIKNGFNGLRIWELKNIKTIDESDAAFNTIIHQIRGNHLIRILPHIDNQFIHNSSISLSQGGSTQPYYFNNSTISLINWYMIDQFFSIYLNNNNLIGFSLSNHFLDFSSLKSFKFFLNSSGFLFLSGIYRNAIFYSNFFSSSPTPSLSISSHNYRFLFNLIESRSPERAFIIDNAHNFFKYNHNSFLRYFKSFMYPEPSIPNKYYLNLLDNRPNKINLNLFTRPSDSPTVKSIQPSLFNIFIGSAPLLNPGSHYLFIPLTFPYTKHYLNLNGILKSTSSINKNGKNILQYLSGSHLTSTLPGNPSNISPASLFHSFKKDLYREHLASKFNYSLYPLFKFIL